ncbi:MAG: fluoride efflux transporter CrcB [Francisellaceae bacterium]
MALLFIFIGGGLGATGRFGFSTLINKCLGTSFPYGILMVNILGCFMIGVLAAFFQRASMVEHLLAPHLRSFLITGFLGGFTTFSSFSLDALILIQKGQWLKALTYIILSVAISMCAVFAGFLLIHRNG